MENLKLELITAYIRELFNMDSVQEEYSDDNYTIKISSEKENDDTIVMRITLKEHQDTTKKEFEEWVDKLDDDVFNTTWETLSEHYGLKDLNDIYNSDQYEDVIQLFKEEAKKNAFLKVKELNDMFNF